MTANAKSKSFDCVRCMRQIRDRIDEEIADMTYAELTQWLRTHTNTQTQLCIA